MALRRVKSVNNERKSEKKKFRDKYSDQLNTFRVRYSNRYTNNNPPANTNQSDNTTRRETSIESFNSLQFDNLTIPLQQSNIYGLSENQQRLKEDVPPFYQILAVTPTTAFELLPLSSHANNNMGFPVQTVPNSYPDNILSGFQDRTTMNNLADNVNNQLQINLGANLGAFNQTVPGNTPHTHHHHHGLDHYHSDSSLLIPNNLLNTYGHHPIPSNGNSTDISINRQSPPLSSTVGVTATSTHNTVPPLPQNSSDSHGVPTRPSPPSLPGGPEYFQASEDFRMCFRRVDSDDNGFITLEELRIFLENKDKSKFNDDTVLTIMDMFDMNKDNMIDASEFPDMLAFIKNWDSCFAFLDSDNSGTIDYREMLEAIKYLGFDNLSHKFTAMLLRKYDCASSGQINLDNFILACVTLCRYQKLYRNMEQMFGSTGPKINLEQFICLFMWPNMNVQ